MGTFIGTLNLLPNKKNKTQDLKQDDYCKLECRLADCPFLARTHCCLNACQRNLCLMFLNLMFFCYNYLWRNICHKYSKKCVILSLHRKQNVS